MLRSKRSQTRVCVLLVLLAASLPACGNDDSTVRARGAEGLTGVNGDLAVEVLHVGENTDEEPAPRGTVKLSGTTDRYGWVQAISKEDFARLSSEAGNSPPRQDLGYGVTMSVWDAENGDYWLMTNDSSISPEETTDILRNLPGTTDAVEFLPVSVAATVGIDYDPNVGPVELMTTGTYLLKVDMNGGTYLATAFEATPQSMASLLMIDRQRVAENIWTGKTEPNRSVAVLEDPSRSRVIVIQSPPAIDTLVDQAPQLMDEVGRLL